MDRRGDRGHFGYAAFGRVFGQRLLEGDIAAVYRVRQFRLQEVAFEVYPHEERAEITYLIVILHLVDDRSVQHQIRYEEERRGKSALDTEVHPPVVAVGVLGVFRFIRSGHNRQLSPHGCGEGQQTNPEKQPSSSHNQFLFITFSSLPTSRISRFSLPVRNSRHARKPAGWILPAPVFRFPYSGGRCRRVHSPHRQ